MTKLREYREPERQVPVDGEYDVAVCGGGAAGFVAAIAAARQGARTLLIERNGILGGTATAGMMVEFGSIHDGRQVLVGGVPHEFMHRMADFGGAVFHNEDTHHMVFDPETMIATCAAMVRECGADQWLHSLAVGPLMENGRVAGVVVENKSGRRAARARVVVDGTGDGDVAARAGAAFDVGRPGDGRLQPVTLEILLGNVDATRVTYPHKELIPKIAAARAAGRWTIPTDQLFSWGAVPRRGAPDRPESSRFFINGTNVTGCDGSSAASLTRAEVEARAQVDQMVEFLRQNAPGFERCYLDRTAAQIGVRETRRIRGDYALTREDVLGARHFPDGIVPGRNSIDVHDVAGMVFEHEYLREGSHYQIPYRCFLPAGLDGLLVTGRCLSADHPALGSVRVMAVCMPMGEAVGIAAALAARRGISPRELPAGEIRAALRAGGTVI